MGNGSFEAASERVQKLAQEFDENKKFYLSTEYQESEVRKDFIDKFLIALGWDVNHETQKNPFKQEVKVERGVAIGQSQRRADYAFYIDPDFRDPQLFAEAKKPASDLSSADNCFQTIRYGWNASMRIAVLTNFEQFIILDCRYKPDIDTATEQIIQKFHFSEYGDSEKFAEIFYLFSRDAIAGGSLEKYAEKLPKRRGKAVQRGLFKGGWQPVDESFLEELDSYRDVLARNFKNHNPELDGETLTEVTQRTIDRLVFLRFLEDKLIESEPHVSEFGDKGHAWREFVTLSRHLDHIYNGIVFKKHDILDAPDFKVDETQFGDLCEELAHANSPYDFNFIPIHILGSIYERFLGKVIIVTNKQAHIEPKPEVRKAGGVYYTPDYIVRYIVENTVGKLIAGKTPAQITEMRFADIACGSGSFLIAIYDLLLHYHRDWYNGHPSRAEKDDCVKRDDGFWHLSLRQRRKILLNNIYGVDIDSQAVEVAQLSLYLKLLEEETTASARNYQLEFHETLLPPLNKNIVCGNSLIGLDILDGHLFPAEEERKLNPMNFENRFPEVIKRGGFDAIVGNPPYIQLSMKEFRNEIVNSYLRETYKFSGGRLNTFAFFIERARKKLSEGGTLGYIVPNTILSQEYYEDLRLKMIQETIIDSITIPVGQVFKDAVVETAILILKKDDRARNKKSKSYIRFSMLREDGRIEGSADIPQKKLLRNYKASFVTPLDPAIAAIRYRMDKNPEKFGRWLNVNQAIALKHDRAACLTQTKQTDAHREILDGRHIERYFTGESPNYFKFDLSKIHSCKRKDIFLLPEKILFRRVGESLVGSLDTEMKFALNTLVVMSPVPDCPYDLRFILGLFNSKVLNFYYVNFLKSTKKIFSEIQARQVEQLPISALDMSDNLDRIRHDRLVSYVNQILIAKKALKAAKTDKDKTYLESKCEMLDRQIDQLVYELYGLSEDEIKIVESSTHPEDKS
jgi:type I restriction-modification system DNA methylase subunit